MDLHTYSVVAMAIPLLGAAAILAFGRWPNLREGATLLTAAALLAVVSCGIAPLVLVDGFWTGAWEAPAFELIHMVPDLALSFKIEPLGLVYALVASSLWLMNSVYAIGYMRGNKEEHQTRFYLCFAVAMFSVMGIAFASNMFTLFVFYEVLTLSTFPLVSHKGTPHAVRSASTYLGILVFTSVCLLLVGVIATAVVTGGAENGYAGLDFTRGGVFLNYLNEGGDVAKGIVGLLFILYIYGIGKAALMPSHRWLPAAMVAPTPVSAFLHAVAVVKAGVFSVLKITVYIFGTGTLAAISGTDWLIYMAGFTIVVASFIAMFQDNLKRRLAYSTISQLSYIIMAAGLATLGGAVAPIAIMAGGMHIIAHAFGKITLFFAAGSIYTAAHKTDVSQLDGIGRRMPWTMAAFAIASLSMIGVPPTAGFLSKWYLLSGALTSADGGGTLSTVQWYAVVVIFLSTVLNAGYFLPIVHRAFFRPLSADAEAHPHGEAPKPIVLALCCTAVGTVALFFCSDLAVALVEQLQAGFPSSLVNGGF